MDIQDTNRTLPSNHMVFELRRDAEAHALLKSDGFQI